MKKTMKMVGMACVAVISTMVLAACGGSASGTNANTNTSGAASTNASAGSGIKMATGGTTGTYYAFGGVVAQAVGQLVDGTNIVVHSSGASKANIFEIADGIADMAIVQNDVAYYAYNGTDLFEADGATTDFGVLGGAYAEVVQIVAKPNISGIEDLKGKVVSVGDAGSGTEFNARQILESYGMTLSDIKVQNLSFGDSAQALKDGKIDAFFCVAGAPTTAVVELATQNDIKILSIDPEHLASLKEKYPFYTEYKIPAGIYNKVDEESISVAVKATFIVSNKLSEDEVYNITKAIYENPDKISHAKAAELNAAYAVDGISIPFHPGAKKYFEEVGVLK